MPDTDDTIVQVRDQKGDWTDYCRTTRPAALAALAAGRLPGNADPEPLRAVDWITKEPISPHPKPAWRVAAEEGGKLEPLPRATDEQIAANRIRYRSPKAESQGGTPMTETATATDSQPKAESAAAKTLTPKDVAEKFGTDSKTLRRFLRKQRPDAKPGQGGRWEIPAADVAKLKKQFTAWTKAETERKAEAANEKAAKAQTPPAEGQEPAAESKLRAPTPEDETEAETEAESLEDDDEADEEPQPERQADVVDAVQARGGLPKVEAAKAEIKKTNRAAARAARNAKAAAS